MWTCRRRPRCRPSPTWTTTRGLLLATTSHGDASLAALEPGVHLVAAAHHANGRYRLATEGLGEYLISKRADAADGERIRSSGRGIACTRSAFAYVFQVD